MLKAAWLFALLVLTAGAGCDSRDQPTTSPPVDAAPNVCEERGGYCHVAYVNHGPGTPCAQTLNIACPDPGAECCVAADNPIVGSCAGRACNVGNACDGTVAGYCVGATLNPNCGQYLCVNGCTCADAGTGCDCPDCQPLAGGTNGHSCEADQSEALWQCAFGEPPATAGRCRYVAAQYYCCAP